MIQHISKIKVLTIFLNVLFLSGTVSALPDQENPLTKAIQLFDKRKFGEAEVVFKKLMDEKPEDFMINYFYGASRTENGHFSDSDLRCLEKASKEVYPIDIDYYFGVQYHARNLFNKALIYYNNYRKVASDEEIKRVNLPAKIDLCEQRQNPFIAEATEIAVADSSVQVSAVAETENIPDSSIERETAISVLVVTTTAPETDPTSKNVPADTLLQIQEPGSAVKENNVTHAEAKESQQNAGIRKPAEPLINFNINSEITYLYESHFKTSEGAAYFSEANAKQAEMDKIALRTEILRGQYTKSKSSAEKDSLGQLIIELENETYQMKGAVKQLFVKSKTAENNYWQNSTTEEKEKFLNELDEIEKAIANEKSEEKVTPVTNILLSPLLAEDAPIEKPVKENKSTGIIYKIQLGAFSKGIPNNLKPVFKKITVIRKVENYIDDKGVVVYTTGNLNTYDDAAVMLNQVKQEGVKDAIVAAYQNGKRITLEQAKETEKQK